MSNKPKKRIAVVGAGISGVAAAKMLSEHADVVVFEQNEKIGGLIRCDNLPEGLYHKLGGHVFNTKSPAVAEWFWRHFDRDKEFYVLNRDARILFGDAEVGYPLENHLYQLPEAMIQQVMTDLLGKVSEKSATVPANFKEALLSIFGRTLCEQYFFPYNEKVWRTDLAGIPTGWLEGKLPMPDIKEILLSNILRKAESGMVHSKFYYAKEGGSQFIVDRLAQGLDIRLRSPVRSLAKTTEGRWQINDAIDLVFDRVVLTADVRTLGDLLPELAEFAPWRAVREHRTRGITNVFCECDPTEVSWLYLPEAKYAANRIIYTGAFSPANNKTPRMTCVVEFVYGESEERIEKDLAALPGRLRRVAINHVKDAYVIQAEDTRAKINEIKMWCQAHRLDLVGRFAEWEYYNIDKAIEAAMNVLRVDYAVT